MTHLYEHQQRAIDQVLSENFQSGVIQYATGTGKSIIGFNIVNEYHHRNPTKYVFWICEHKFILKDQFTNNAHIKQSAIINYSDLVKPADWVSLVNQTKIWKKPMLIVINRAFLTINEKYKQLKIPVGLVIHDECHSISSDTTREFLNWLPNDCSKIGLSATPLYQYEPLTRKICEFNIVDAIQANIVAKPLIIHTTNATSIIDKLSVIHLYLTEHSVFGKIIIWCGTINNTQSMLNLWIQTYGESVHRCFISHSGLKNNDDQLFNAADTNAILFCACGHHEASDFRNLDGCALLDGVKQRTDKMFMQCLGRVIRKHANKTHGWILDFDALNSKQLCDTVMQFVNKANWQFVYNTSNKDHIQIHTISIEMGRTVLLPQSNNVCETHFVRACPNHSEYKFRLQYELNMINGKQLAKYLLKAVQVRDLCENDLFITRGSCGSSLVCYLLGLTHVDPVKYNINFVRFLHEERNELPDIDFDFAYNVRDDVFVKINANFDNVSRISCDVKWCERSATREALRQMNFTSQLTNQALNILLKTLSPGQRAQMNNIKQTLIGNTRTTMLHVGGIIFDQTENINHGKSGLLQVSNETKQSLSKKHIFKIDILSSRALAILRDIWPKHNNNDFEHIIHCEKTYSLLASGNNLGLVLAESVLMKRAFMLYRPKNIHDIAQCLAIVRPMSKMAREHIDYDQLLVYDDDAIEYIKQIMGCSYSTADVMRRRIIKCDKGALQTFLAYLQVKVPKEQMNFHLQLLSRMTEYGFCKAHAVSYAMLVYQLAYAKVHHPLLFWKAAINHADSTYAPWVHIIEAVSNGVDLRDTSLLRNNVSIYSNVRKTHGEMHLQSLTPTQQLVQYGYWQSIFEGEYFPDCYLTDIGGGLYKFRGIIAAFRTPNALIKQKKMGFYLGVGLNSYLDIVLPKLKYNKDTVIITGFCKWSNEAEGIMEGFRCESE